MVHFPIFDEDTGIPARRLDNGDPEPLITDIGRRNRAPWTDGEAEGAWSGLILDAKRLEKPPAGQDGPGCADQGIVLSGWRMKIRRGAQTRGKNCRQGGGSV